MAMIDRRETAEPADVLLVEPSEERARLSRDGLTDGGETDSRTRIHVVPDGEAALEFLERRGEYADAPAPSLAVVRFDLPDSGPDALEVLEAMAERPELARIPTVVTADDPAEAVIADAYLEGANAVVPTPSDPESYRETMAFVARFWIATARLPNRTDRL